MSDFKVLSVRQHIYKGVPRHEETECAVFVVPDGKELPSGFSRIANVGGVPIFKLLESFDGKAFLTPDRPVPFTVLNGVAKEEACETPFNTGDIVIVHYVYEDPDHISRDTVTLVPNDIPASFTV